MFYPTSVFNFDFCNFFYVLDKTMCDYPLNSRISLHVIHLNEVKSLSPSLVMHWISSPVSYVPKRFQIGLNFSSNFCVQFWFLQFRQCFMFRTRLCDIILLSLILSFAKCWFSPLGLFFIIASWSWHGRLVTKHLCSQRDSMGSRFHPSFVFILTFAFSLMLLCFGQDSVWSSFSAYSFHYRVFVHYWVFGLAC